MMYLYEYNSVYRRCVSFMRFGGQTFKNVHDVRKICLELTFCVLACFVEFYVFILDEIDMRGPKFLQSYSSLKHLGKSPQRPTKGA